MSDHSQFSHFQGLFERALQDYEDQTGTALARHPFAEQLQSCNSVDSILSILQQQAQAFTEFRGSNGRIMRSLKSAVSVIYALSNSTTLRVISMVPFPPAQAIFSGVAVLLAVCAFLRSRHVYLCDIQMYQAVKDVSFFFFFFLNPNLYPATRPTRDRGGHASIYVLCLGFYGVLSKRLRVWAKGCV